MLSIHTELQHQFRQLPLNVFNCATQPPYDGFIDSDVRFPGGPVFHCNRKHPHNHRCCCCEVQLRSAHPPLRPHTEGHCSLQHSTNNKKVLFFKQPVLLLFRAGKLKVTAWGRSCSVWSGGSAERLALRLQLERYVTVPVQLSRPWKVKVRRVKLHIVRFRYDSSALRVCVFRCWRCCGSWLTSPLCPPASFSRRWRSTWGFWVTLTLSRRPLSAVTSLNVSRTLRRWDVKCTTNA